MRAAIALLVLAGAVRGEEHPGFNFAIDWPGGDGWEAPKDELAAEGSLRRSARNRDLGRGLQVQVVPAGDTTLAGDRYARDLVKGISTSLAGAKVVSELRHEVGGVPALTLRVVAEHDGETISMLHRALLADDRLYGVTAMSTDDDEAWMEESLHGFRFLAQPAAPSWFEQKSYAFGGDVLGPLLLVGLVVGIVLLVRRLARRRGARSG